MPESASGGVCFGGCLLPGVSALGGLLRGVSVLGRGSAPGGMSAPGVCLLWGGVCSRGCLIWGVSAPGGVSALGCGIPACTKVDTPPVNRMTNRCKNFVVAGKNRR